MNQKTLINSVDMLEVQPTPVDRSHPTVADALESYLIQLKAGEKPGRDEFLNRYSEHADELGECLDGLELVQHAAQQMLTTEPRLFDDLVGNPPTRLGEFRIVREVGRGGMGIVYEAVQDSLSRRVALKVLASSSGFDPKQRRRFQIEAQAAAQLKHDHIAPVFAVGAEAGVSFYAMHFIDGWTVAQIIERLRSSRSETVPNSPQVHVLSPAKPARSNADRSTLEEVLACAQYKSTREFFIVVARLGIEACEALEHAHSLGVVHRDVKPSNLMVDPVGKLWVTDFGLARFQDESGVTHTGELLGTLRYMSPEQALGQGMMVDQRTDVYSLGATLYELLTLEPALDGRDRNELVRQAAEHDPTPPRRIDRAIPRDLETIVMKALAKEPRERYSTAADLAADLRRFLDDRPVLARRAGLFTRVHKWARRHKPLVLSASSILFLSMSIAAGLIWVEKRQTQDALARARQPQARERDYLRFVLSVSDRVTTEAIRMLSPEDSHQAEQLCESYRQLLFIYERIAPQYRDDPKMRDLAAQAYHRIAFIGILRDDLLGTPGASFQHSNSAYETSISLYHKLIEAEPHRLDLKARFALVLEDYGGFLWRENRTSQAEACLTRALELGRAIAGTARSLDARLGLGCKYVKISLLYSYLGDHAKARSMYASGKAILGQISDEVEKGVWKTDFRSNLDEPFDWSCALGSLDSSPVHRIVSAENELIAILLSNGCAAEAEEVARIGLRCDPENSNLMNNLAWAMTTSLQTSHGAAAEAVELARKVVDHNPAFGDAWNTLGVALYRAGRLDEAEDAFTKSMGKRSGGDAYDWFMMAMIKFRQGREAEAIGWYDRAIGLFQKLRSVDQPLQNIRTEASRMVNVRSSRISARVASPTPRAQAKASL